MIAWANVSDDRVAFGELVRRYQSPLVRNFLRHLTSGDAALADDLAQETSLQAYRGLARYRGEGNLGDLASDAAHNELPQRPPAPPHRGGRAGTRDRRRSPRFFPPWAADHHDLASALNRLSSD